MALKFRVGLGRKLTWQEADGNWSFLKGLIDGLQNSLTNTISTTIPQYFSLCVHRNRPYRAVSSGGTIELLHTDNIVYIGSGITSFNCIAWTSFFTSKPEARRFTLISEELKDYFDNPSNPSPTTVISLSCDIYFKDGSKSSDWDLGARVQSSLEIQWVPAINAYVEI